MKTMTKTLCGMLMNGQLLLISASFLLPALTNAQQAGDLDLTFSGDGKVLPVVVGGYSYANAVALQPDGKIITAGQINDGWDAKYGVMRFNADGTLDNTFSGDGMVATSFANGSNIAYSIALQSDGKIVVAGYSVNGSNSDFFIARYNSDGTLDNTFSGDGKVLTDLGSNYDRGHAVALQSDEKIVVAGLFHNATSVDYDFGVVRYKSDGTVDSTFSEDGIQTLDLGNGQDDAHSVAIQSDGKIIIAGYAETETHRDIAVVRYNTDGTLDNTFSEDGIQLTDVGGNQDRGYAVALQPDGKIVVTGMSNTNTGQNYFELCVVRYNSDGTLDNTFSGDGMQTTAVAPQYSVGRSVAIQPDGKIVVAGSASQTYEDFAVVRYNSDGTLDNTFSGDGMQTTVFEATSDDDEGRAVVLQPDGKIIVAGKHETYSGVIYTAIARYHGQGSLVTGIDAGSEHAGVEVYPNPSNGLFNVVMDGMDGTVSLSVYDLQGREVVSQSLTPRGRTTHTIDLSSFATGVYTLQMNTPTGTLTQKLVRE